MAELGYWQMEYGTWNVELFAFSPYLPEHILWINECLLPNVKGKYTNPVTDFS